MGVPVPIKSYFAGQYQSPVLRLELGENKTVASRDPKYVISKNGKVTVPSVKLHEVFEIKVPTVNVRGKLRGKSPVL